MAQPTDLTGMLTAGLFEPTQQAIPSSFQEAMIRQAQQAGTGLRRGLGAMTGADTRTNPEVARAAMQGLDINNPAHQPKILQIVRKYAPEREAALVAQFAQQGRVRAEKEKKEGQAKAAAEIEETRYQEKLQLKQREVAVAEGKLKDDGPLPTKAQNALLSQAEQRNITPEAKKALILGLETGLVTKLSDVDEYVETDFDPASVYTKEVSRTIESANKLYKEGSRGAASADRLLNDIFASGALDTRGGIFATVTEGIKEFAGIRDSVSYLRTRATKDINTAIVEGLPAGVASDRDIVIFSKGFPNADTATFQEITEYLEAAKRINQIIANDAAFKNYHITTSIKNKRTANLENYIPASRKYHRGKEQLDKLYNEPNITPEQKRNLLDSFQEAFGILPVEYN